MGRSFFVLSRMAGMARMARVARSALALGAVLAAGACASKPEYMRLPQEPLMDWANARYEDEDWARAIDGFERLIFTFPSNPRVPEARVKMAWSYFQRKEYVTAAAEFQRMVERHPTDPRVPEATLGICRSYAELSPIPQRDQQYTQQALVTCANMAADFAGTPEAEEAREIRDDMVAKLAMKEYLRGEFYFRRKFYDSANIYFQQVLQRYPQSPAAPMALLRIYEGYQAIGYEEDAQETRDQLLRQYPESDQARQLREGGDSAGQAGSAS